MQIILLRHTNIAIYELTTANRTAFNKILLLYLNNTERKSIFNLYFKYLGCSRSERVTT